MGSASVLRLRRNSALRPGCDLRQALRGIGVLSRLLHLPQQGGCMPDGWSAEELRSAKINQTSKDGLQQNHWKMAAFNMHLHLAACSCLTITLPGDAARD
jgi:hypothetical protein